MPVVPKPSVVNTFALVYSGSLDCHLFLGMICRYLASYTTIPVHFYYTG